MTSDDHAPAPIYSLSICLSHLCSVLWSIFPSNKVTGSTPVNSFKFQILVSVCQKANERSIELQLFERFVVFMVFGISTIYIIKEGQLLGQLFENSPVLYKMSNHISNNICGINFKYG